MTYVIVLTLMGLALFMAGQWYGQRQTKKKAENVCAMMDKAFTSYRENMEIVLREHGLDPQVLEAEALSNHIEKTVQGIKEHLESLQKKAPTKLMLISSNEAIKNENKEPSNKGD